MSRIANIHYENVAHNNGRNIPIVSRDKIPRHDGRKGIFIRDSLDSTSDIDNFNNYSKSGMLLSDIKSSNHQAQTAMSVLNNVNADMNRESDNLIASGETLKTEQSSMPIFVSAVSVDQAVRQTDKYYEVWRINKYMHDGFLDFVAGKIDANEVAGIAERMYKDMLSFNIQMGRTDGNDLEFNEKLLYTTHAHFAFYAVNALWFDMHSKGFEYAKETFGFTHPVSDRFIYYDADYYYASKELQAVGDTAFSRIAMEEGLSKFRAADLYNGENGWAHCFNTLVNMNSGAGNAGIAIMKDVSISPPRGFKMFFSPFRHSLEARDNGSVYVIAANDPLKHNGHTGVDAYISVPKGAELWRSLPFWLRLTEVAQNYGSDNNTPIVATYDISKHIAPGVDFQKSVKDFFSKYVNNPFSGALAVWYNGTMTEYDVPFDLFFEDIRQFDGKQLVPPGSYDEFMSNFEFHMFIQ